MRWRKSASRRLALFSLVATLAIVTRARAGEDLEALATDPVTLSEIEHDDLHVGVDTWGALLSSATGTKAHDVAALSQHVRIESPVVTRNFYLHLDYQEGSAASPSYAGTKFLSGNVVAGLRAVWFHAQGAAFGADFGLATPTARYGSDQARDISLVLASMRPWDYDAFRGESVVLLPALDVRAVFGPVTLQLRHQVDYALGTSDKTRSDLSSTTTLYAGVRVKDVISPGIELAELYLLDGSIKDDARSEAVIAPSVRFNLGRASPEVGMLTNVGQLVHPDLDRVIAVRVSCIFALEPSVLIP